MRHELGEFFSAIQLITNALALLGGLVGDNAFAPLFDQLFKQLLPADIAGQTAGVTSFAVATLLFVIFADLIPKSFALARAESAALACARPMTAAIAIFRPIVRGLDRFSKAFMRLLSIPCEAEEKTTSEDILAMVTAGVEASVIAAKSEPVIGRVMSMNRRLAASVMTARNDLTVIFDDDDEDAIRRRLLSLKEEFILLCRGSVDCVLGSIRTQALVQMLAAGKPFYSLKQLAKPVIFVPDALTLEETLDRLFRSQADCAIAVNEYRLTAGAATAANVMQAVMGDCANDPQTFLVAHHADGNVVADVGAAIEDVEALLGEAIWPQERPYDTLGGFFMATLRRLPAPGYPTAISGWQLCVKSLKGRRVREMEIFRNAPQSRQDRTVQQ